MRVEKELENFPKKDIEIKNRIRTTIFDMLDIAYYANTTFDVETKKRLIEQLIAKIKVIDFLLNLALQKELITGKKYIKLGDKLNDIAKYSNGWLKVMSEDKKE